MSHTHIIMTISFLKKCKSYKLFYKLKKKKIVDVMSGSLS